MQTKGKALTFPSMCTSTNELLFHSFNCWKSLNSIETGIVKSVDSSIIMTALKIAASSNASSARSIR